MPIHFDCISYSIEIIIITMFVRQKYVSVCKTYKVMYKYYILVNLISSTSTLVDTDESTS